MTELERLSQEFNNAWVKKDAAYVEQMLTPEYVYIAPNGKVLDRDAIVGIIRNPTYNLQRATRTEVQTIPLTRDAVAIVFRSRAAGSLQGRSFVDDHRSVTVFVKRGRKWQVAFEQASAIA